MIDVRSNYFRILDRIHHAAARSGRDAATIRLIAVTKTVSPDIIRQAAESGIKHVGENRLQEALSKKQALADLPLTWHFIGHLQTNKAKKAAAHFDWIQSVDRVELAAKLQETASKQLPVLVEVKLHEEPNKSGVDEETLPDLVENIRRNARLELRGLMAIPPFSDAAEDSRPYFRRLRELAEQFGLSELSMGMSHDFEVAIDEGATMVRIGTALFGERS
jgi:pyridoxal phosphate enzyme (YggS family)